MANYSLPWLINPVALNGGMDTSAARRFARTTRTAAQGLRRGVEEALRSGNESEFNNAYLIFSGQLPSNVNPNDGGERSDVLRRLITASSAIVNPATVAQNELIRLGQRLNSSDSAARADYVVYTPIMRVDAPAGLTVVTSGHKSIRIDSNNPGQANLNLTMSYWRGSSLFVSCQSPFVHSRAGGANQNAVNSVMLNSNDAGAYNFIIPAGTRMVFEVSGTSTVSIDSGSDFTKAERGYQRAKADGLIVNTILYPSLDMWMATMRYVFPNTDSTIALMIMLLETYEDVNVALSLRMNR
uniref:VP8 n=2 Tax=Liao ning virus TaxID=246280 RepID=A0A2P1N6S8_9REOV|nr:VP8 [Liao ning virus]